jgi:hypothetical protein
MAKNRWENLELLTDRDELKFVLASREDYDWAVSACRQRRLFELCPVLFSPVQGQLDPAQLAQWILDDRLPLRFQLQLHKVLWGSAQGRWTLISSSAAGRAAVSPKWSGYSRRRSSARRTGARIRSSRSDPSPRRARPLRRFAAASRLITPSCSQRHFAPMRIASSAIGMTSSGLRKTSTMSTFSGIAARSG